MQVSASGAGSVTCLKPVGTTRTEQITEAGPAVAFTKQNFSLKASGFPLWLESFEMKLTFSPEEMKG